MMSRGRERTEALQVVEVLPHKGHCLFFVWFSPNTMSRLLFRDGKAFTCMKTSE